jgi:hypothetical protein
VPFIPQKSALAAAIALPSLPLHLPLFVLGVAKPNVKIVRLGRCATCRLPEANRNTILQLELQGFRQVWGIVA